MAYHVHLDGNHDGGGGRHRTTVVLTNGLGTTENFWRFLVQELNGDHRIVHWDFRGHGSSERSASSDYSIETQAKDLAQVTERAMAEGAGGPPVHVAFSMGVAVVLELYRTRPELVSGLVLIAGAADAPWALPMSERTAAAVRRLMERATPLVPYVAPLAHAFLSSRLVYPTGRALGMLRRRAPREDIEAFTRALCDMDPQAYWQTLRALMEAHTSDVLPSVSVPTLVMGAANDLFVTKRHLRQLREGLPHAAWLEIEDAGHASLLEAGPEVALAIRDFVQQLGAGEAAALH